MIRKTLTTLSLIGLLLSVGLCGVSLKGFEFATRELRFVFMLHSGQAFARIGDPIPDTMTVPGIVWSHQSSPPRPIEIKEVRKRSLMAFRAATSRNSYFGFRIRPPTGHELQVSLVTPILLFAVSAGVLVLVPLRRRRRQRKNRKRGLCVKCGYDLRASRDRCPECGTGFEARMFPEMSLFDSREGRKTAIRKWQKQLRRSWSWRLYLMFGSTLGVLLGTEAAAWWLQGMLPLWAGVLVGVVVCMLSFSVGMYFLVRRSFVQQMRRELNATGIPVCLQCGYNLLGSAERCPECRSTI